MFLKYYMCFVTCNCNETECKCELITNIKKVFCSGYKTVFSMYYFFCSRKSKFY